MGGAGSGTKQGMELENNFVNWASKKYQERFQGSKGAYILMARAPEPIYWDTAPIEALKLALDDFIKKNPNVDTSRIYVVGWCIGCTGAVKLALKYPKFVAGMILHAPRHIITPRQANKLNNTAIWIITCYFDLYAIYPLYTLPSWINMKIAYSINSSNKFKLRLTTCTYAPKTSPDRSKTLMPGLVMHKVWNYTAYDMSNDGGCKNLKTKDGFGTIIPNSNVHAISWLSQWRAE